MSASSDQNPPLWDRRYAPSDTAMPVEITTTDDLRRKSLGDELLHRLGRVFFHVALICTNGEGIHEVDFTSIALRPQRVVHIQPGQIHRWRFADPYQATLVFFPDTKSMRAPGWPVGPRWFDLDDTEWANTMSVLNLTRGELGLNRSPARRDRALNGALELLIVNLGLDLPRHQDTASLPKPYVELLNQLEDDPDWSRSVTRRAQRLGYSQRTLTRACVAATGRTAKETIDDRVLLEAQRLLVDGDPTISTVAAQLGFSEPASFTRFFQRLTGESPATWHAHT